MVTEQYPIGKAYLVTIKSLEEFERYCKTFCVIFDCVFYGIESSVIYEHYIPFYKCWETENAVNDNGRVVSADKIKTTLTNVDYEIIKSCYTWKGFAVANVRVYAKAYLGTAFVKSILKLYEDKTKLKGLTGATEEETEDIQKRYQISKGMINSAYGMCATDVAKDIYTVKDGEWVCEDVDLEKAIARYNKSYKRFLMYQWAPFVTAYARKNLWFGGIHIFKSDYIYGDTDSCKVINYEKHIKEIETYNKQCIEKLKAAADFHGLPLEMFMPKNAKGEEKPLGVWEHETAGNKYKRFKTLGAKRYAYEDNYGYHITCAGVGKKAGCEYIKSLDGDFFDNFVDGLYFPKGTSGKLCHTYIDEVREGDITDYLGNKGHYREESCVHLEPTEYHLNIDDEYLKLLRGVFREEEYFA